MPLWLRRLTLHAVLLTLALALALPNPEALATMVHPSYKVKTMKTEHFYIHYTEEASAVAQDLAQIAEDTHVRLAPRMRWQPWGRTHVVLLDKTDAANGYATVLPYNYMVLYISHPQAETSLDNYQNYLEMLFTHEYTHILHIDQYSRWAAPLHWLFGKLVAPNGLTPGWVREGIAAYEESQLFDKGRAHYSYTDMVLRTDILHDQFLKIDEVTGYKARPNGFEDKYLYGVAFMDWLAKNYGDDRITQFSIEMASSVSLFSLNNKARRVFGKNFYALWQDWKNDVTTKSMQQKRDIEMRGVTPMQVVATDARDSIASYRYAPDGSAYAIALDSVHNGPRLKIFAQGNTEPTILGRDVRGHMAWSRDGNLLAFGSPAGDKRGNLYTDVMIYNREKKTIRTVRDKLNPKESFRASDPDFSPEAGGGRFLVMVRNELGTENLYMWDTEGARGNYLTRVPRYTQFASPRFSPDGQLIAASRFMEGQRDIALYTKDGEFLRLLTSDTANDNAPDWDPSGQHVYFTSDRSGVANIYRVTVADGHVEPLSNVLTGVTQAQLSADQLEMTVLSYRGHAFDVAKFHMPDWSGIPSVADTNLPQAEMRRLPIRDHPKLYYEPKNYNGLAHLLPPRYLIPSLEVVEDAIFAGIFLGRNDPLLRHSWTVGVNYRSDANFIGYNGNYVYSRFNPALYVGGLKYAVNFGNFFGIGQDFFEDRGQGYIGLSGKIGHSTLKGDYFYEDRSVLKGLPAGAPLLNLGRFAGLRMAYDYRRYSLFPASISKESGPDFQFNFDITDSMLGGNERNEQRIVIGDFRYFLEMPYSDHHVWSWRVKGGITFGDRIVQGTYRLGGPFGESNLGKTSYLLFPLRGLPGVTFVGERALLLSTEYRLPLWVVERGIGTAPIFLRQLHWAFFADYGDIWFPNAHNGMGFFDNFLLGIGAELRGDFLIGYGLPVTGRLGYGVIVTNRDRIAGLNDATFGSDIRNGTLILQLGTSF